MTAIPDAPWIREATTTGHYRYGFWNTMPGAYDDEEEEESYEGPYAVYDPE